VTTTRVIQVRRDGTILWQFGVTAQPGDDSTSLRGPHNADRLLNGNTIIADSGNNRILEVTTGGAIAWQYVPTGADRLDWPRDADDSIPQYSSNRLSPCTADGGNPRAGGMAVWRSASSL